MSAITPQLDNTYLSPTASTNVQLLYIIGVFYKAINIACLRGLISFDVASDVHTVSEHMTAIADQHKKTNKLTPQTYESFLSYYNKLASYVEKCRTSGIYNIKDHVLINAACTYFKQITIPALTAEMSEPAIQNSNVNNSKSAADTKTEEHVEVAPQAPRPLSNIQKPSITPVD